MILYVYYKFNRQQTPDVVTQIKFMQTDLSKRYPGLSVNLLKRPESDQEGRETWMEVYDISNVETAQFTQTLNELAGALDLPQPRRNELFIPA